jgi:hypothetical protein
VLHRLMFMHPRPGLSLRAAQQHWLDVYGPRLVLGDSDIHACLLATAMSTPDGHRSALGMGCVEVWTEPGRLTALLQSECFLRARADEPSFIAFWRTAVLLTEDHESVPGPGPVVPQPAVKLQMVAKRRTGLDLGSFRERCRGGVGSAAGALPGLLRLVQCHVVDESYEVGETPLDAALQLWFRSPEAAGRAMASPEFGVLAGELGVVAEKRYRHLMLTREHWFVVPGERRHRLVRRRPGGD